MAFTEQETHQVLEKLEHEFWAYRRPPLDLRDKIREGQRIDNQSIELFFKRPAFQNPGKMIEDAIVKIKYNRTKDVWAIYWQRADLKWHRYEPCPDADTFSEALKVVNEDAFACFFG